jgi:general secretion pathway protein C
MFVEVVRDGEPVMLRWDIDGDLNEARRAQRMPTPPVPPATRDPFAPRVDPFASRDPWAPSVPPATDPLIDTITTVDETHAELPRSTAERLFADPTLFSTGARVVPAIKNGVPSGFKLYAIRPSSAYAHLNLHNGDTIRAINGYDLDSAATVLDVIPKVKAASTITLDIERYGKPMILTITVK